MRRDHTDGISFKHCHTPHAALLTPSTPRQSLQESKVAENHTPATRHTVVSRVSWYAGRWATVQQCLVQQKICRTRKSPGSALPCQHRLDYFAQVKPVELGPTASCGCATKAMLSLANGILQSRQSPPTPTSTTRVTWQTVCSRFIFSLV